MFISVKGWWKMVIFHLKDGHFSEGSLIGKKKIVFMQSFSIFFEFDFVDFFIWTQIEFLKCMIWQSNFLLFFCFFRCLLFYLFVSSSDTCHRWLSRLSTILHVGIVLNMVVFWSKGLFIPFLSTKKGYGSKGFCFC